MKKILLLLLLLPAITQAEIYKKALVCSDTGQICLYWWPTLPEVQGWHQDMRHSYHYKMNTLALEGYDFSNSEAVIYARSEYQDKPEEKKTLEEFIEFSQGQSIANSPYKFNIENRSEIESEGKLTFVSFSYLPKGNTGNWEQVAYSEETDNDGNHYFLIFALSSRTKEAYLSNLESFNKMITLYQ